MKMNTCFWCGADLGYQYDSREPEACNERECQRELSNEYRGQAEDRQERAREDEYSRY
jgi:hypothetical protein